MLVMFQRWSETAIQPEDPAPQSLVLVDAPEPETGFPAAWLTASDEYVIDLDHWNRECAPKDAPKNAQFSIEWIRFDFTSFLIKTSYGVEIIGLIIRHYFDLPGCIIPIAYVAELSVHPFFFTTAGPCDDDGKKDFYLFHYNTPLNRNSLR
ncbi:hypothetical protein C8R45DRAFT_1088935 [Mycena sanguinolenta]|nr:hypothetical protein C8R45DRAFT_1088935 [Mycena sanguinolenta]